MPRLTLLLLLTSDLLQLCCGSSKTLDSSVEGLGQSVSGLSAAPHKLPSDRQLQQDTSSLDQSVDDLHKDVDAWIDFPFTEPAPNPDQPVLSNQAQERSHPIFKATGNPQAEAKAASKAASQARVQAQAKTWAEAKAKSKAEAKEQAQLETPYVVSKKLTIDVIEQRIKHLAPDMLAPKSRVVDIGGGSGELAHYLQGKHKLNIRSFDVAKPTENKWAHDMPQELNFPVEVFDGSHLTQLPDKSVDTALFIFSLHHAGRNQQQLLAEAARVSRKYVLVFEDLDDDKLKVRQRHAKHDPLGIYRSKKAWLMMFKRHGLSLLGDGTVRLHPNRNNYFKHYFLLSTTAAAASSTSN